MRPLPFFHFTHFGDVFGFAKRQTIRTDTAASKIKTTAQIR
jgi:hypothetical protein